MIAIIKASGVIFTALTLSTLFFFTSTSMAHADLRQNNLGPSEVCDPGLFVLGNGETFTFEEMVLEGSNVTNWNTFGQVTAFGYMAFAQIPDDVSARTQAYLSDFDDCEYWSRRVWINRAIKIDAIALPDGRTADEYKEIRRMFLMATDGNFSKALVRLTGRFGIYRNSYEPFFLIDEFEIID